MTAVAESVLTGTGFVGMAQLGVVAIRLNCNGLASRGETGGPWWACPFLRLSNCLSLTSANITVQGGNEPQYHSQYGSYIPIFQAAKQHGYMTTY